MLAGAPAPYAAAKGASAIGSSEFAPKAETRMVLMSVAISLCEMPA